MAMCMVLEQLKKKQDMFIITKEELGKPPKHVDKLLDFKINIKKQQNGNKRKN